MAKTPDRIGKYEVIRRLGYGGMGTVYLARDPDLDRLLAIKVLRDLLFEDELIQRFLQEARAAGNLRHENIITVYDAGQHDHQPFMAMEYVDGVSLGEMIRSRQPLALADKLSYLEQICSGLHYAHGQGIVHRDIKPANLMVDRRNVVRILDFGIARVEGSGMTRDGALMGTLSYMSPEQMLGRPVDHRSDMFAFGAVAYELLAYEKAFPGTIEDGLLQRLPQEPPRPLSELCPGLPGELEPLVMRTLAKRPDDRFADLEEARVALRQIRRQVDPQLELEPIAVSRRGGAGSGSGTPTPGSAAERAEFLERRARQLAYHRDAARAAFVARDLDGAVAACEDALTLDPDDEEALQLLSEIQQAREQRGLESKERRDRERTVRKHLADADLKLSKGDVASAADILRQVLTLDPRNPAALAMLSRIEQAATSHGMVLPTLVRPDSRRAAPVQDGVNGDTLPHERPSTPAAESRTPSSLPIRRVAAAGGVAAAVIVSGFLWISSRSDDAAPAEAVTASAGPDAASPAPVPEALPPPVSRPESTPPAIVDSDRSLQEQLVQIGETHRKGDFEGALAAIRPVLARTNDDRARGLARTIAIDARRAMTAAAAAARNQKAPDHSPGVFATAERARALSERAFGRNDFVEAGTQALLATANYSHAEREAVAAAAKAVTSPPRTADVAGAEDPALAPTVPQTPAATAAVAAVTNPGPVNAPPVVPPPVAAAPTPPPATAPSSAPAAASTAAASSAIDVERAGMLRAMNRYQDAYRERSVKALQAVYPSLPREAGQQLEKTFRECRAYDFAYLNPQFALNADDPTSATVTARTSYTCQPRTGQAPPVSSGQEVFLLRKTGDVWLIDRAIMDPRAR